MSRLIIWPISSCCTGHSQSTQRTGTGKCTSHRTWRSSRHKYVVEFHRSSKECGGDDVFVEGEREEQVRKTGENLSRFVRKAKAKFHFVVLSSFLDRLIEDYFTFDTSSIIDGEELAKKRGLVDLDRIPFLIQTISDCHM